MRAPKVLFVTTVHHTLRAFLLPFARHFRAQGWTVDAMAQGISSSPECGSEFDRTWEINWSRNPLAAAKLLPTPRQIREIVYGEGYDLVHVHTPVAAFILRLALRNRSRNRRPQIIYTAHGFHFHDRSSLLRNWFFIWLERSVSSSTDYLVVINRDDREAARRYRLAPVERLRWMPGIGVEVEKYGNLVDTDAVLALRRELGIGPDAPLFLMIGEFNGNKRHKDLLQAFARLPSRVHLALAGAGRLIEPVRRLAIALGVEGRVHFLGFRRDIPVLLKASAAVVLPSAREGLPRSLMEAYCMGVPCIGSNIRGIRDLVDTETGLLFQPGDIDGLAGAMRWVLDHPQEARSRGEAGRRRMLQYDVKHLLLLHEQMYAEALANAGVETGTSAIAAVART